MSIGWAGFDTAIGRCAIAWSDAGIAGVQLPERDAAALRACMRRRFPDAAQEPPPPAVQSVIDRVVAELEGLTSDDLADVPLDLRAVSPFDARVYAEVRKIAPGQTATYGEIARRVGSPGAARAIGGAMGRNPFAPIVPCHRVVAAGGRLGGFSAAGGAKTKQRMLAVEARAARRTRQPA